MNDLLNYYEIMEMALDEDYDRDMIAERAQSAIIQHAKSSYDKLKTESSKFFSYLDGAVTKGINDLKKAGKNVKIKMSGKIKDAIAEINKDVPDMLTSMNKYTKATIYGKSTFAVSNIAGWTVPVLIPIPGASEMLFTVAETLNYLLEFKRRWSGSNRSAINDFVVRCNEASENIDASMIGADKTCNSAIKLFKYMFGVVKSIMDAVTMTLQSKLIAGYSHIYSGTEKLGKKVADKTEGSTGKIGNTVYKFASKTEEVGKGLKEDSETAKKAYKELKDKRKESVKQKLKIKPGKKKIVDPNNEQ